MKNSKTELIIIGIGNAGREDDGLGWSFLDAIQGKVPEHVQLEYRYQLNIEDAELVASAKTILFVDAQKPTDGKPFYFEACMPKESYEFSSHALGPEVVLALSQQLFHAYPKAFLLTISGYKWELAEGLSQKAKANLAKAIEFLETEQASMLGHPKMVAY